MPSAVAAGGQAIFDLLPVESPASLEPKITVIRAIMEVGMTGTAGSLDFHGAFGMYTETRDAVTAGAVADPLVDYVDWYWHKNYFGRRDPDAGPSVMYFNIDLRTARVIRGVGRTLVFVLDVNAAAGTGVSFSVNARLLLAH